MRLVILACILGALGLIAWYVYRSYGRESTEMPNEEEKAELRFGDMELVPSASRVLGLHGLCRWSVAKTEVLF